MNPFKYIVLALLQVYRWIVSPAKIFLFGPGARCRFTPTCSQYALQAVKTHGALSGGWLATKRVCRCHPWGGAGYDPVPDATVDANQPGAPAHSGTHAPPLTAPAQLK